MVIAAEKRTMLKIPWNLFINDSSAIALKYKVTLYYKANMVNTVIQNNRLLALTSIIL